MIKKINKEIQKLQQQTIKNRKRNHLDDEISMNNSRLKELNLLKKQYEKLEQNTDSVCVQYSSGSKITSNLR